jgi:hypothetical protein
MSKAKPPRRPGPPKAFDADMALKAAMFVSGARDLMVLRCRT